VSGADASVHDGRIVLTGMAIHSALVEDASKLAGAIAGVKAVENQMVVVRGPRALP
jgi:osmotically-inducible protein OsmY